MMWEERNLFDLVRLFGVYCYFYCLMCGGCGCMLSCVLVVVVPSLSLLSWACRTPVVDVLATTVLCCNVLMSTLLFDVSSTDGVRLDPLMFP